MNHFLLSTYITTTAVSIFFSLLIIFAQKLLAINKMFLYIGICLLLLSLMSLAHTLIYIDITYGFTRELLLFIRICGLNAGFSLAKMLDFLNPAILNKRKKTIGYVLLSLYLTVFICDILFNFGIFFYIDDSKIYSTLFFRFIYIPMAYGGLVSIMYFFFQALKLVPQKHKQPVKTLLFGVCGFIGFEFWDLSKLIKHSDIMKYKATKHNFGIILLLISILIFFIELIRTHNCQDVLSYTFIQSNVNAMQMKLYSRLIKIIERDKLYLDPDISIETTAALLQTSDTSVSSSVNKCSGINFSTLLNRYRVEEMKIKLSDPENTQSIIDIGMESGFNSRTSMNRAFFQLEKTTPSEYRQKKRYGSVSGSYSTIQK